MPIAYLLLLITHFVGLSLAVGASFAQFTLRAASGDLEPTARVQFMLRALSLNKNASIGLSLLLVSGLGMLFMRGVGATMAMGGPAFHAKLTLVVILVGVFGYAQVLGKRARQGGGAPVLAKLRTLSTLLLGLGLAIIVAAVIAFQ